MESSFHRHHKALDLTSHRTVGYRLNQRGHFEVVTQTIVLRGLLEVSPIRNKCFVLIPAGSKSWVATPSPEEEEVAISDSNGGD